MNINLNILASQLKKKLGLKDGRPGEKGADGSPDTGKEIVAKINDLKITPTQMIDASHIKGLLMPIGGGTANTSGGGVQSVVAGSNVTVDNTDPSNPIVSSTGGDLAPYVPYTGATSDVNLGVYSLLAKRLQFTDNEGQLNDFNGNAVVVSTGTANQLYSPSGGLALDFTTPDSPVFANTSGYTTILDLSGVVSNISLAVQSQSGTVALLSDIPDVSVFVPYTGATANVDLGAHTLNVGSLVKINDSTGAGIDVNLTVGDTATIDTKGSNFSITGSAGNGTGIGGDVYVVSGFGGATSTRSGDVFLYPREGNSGGLQGHVKIIDPIYGYSAIFDTSNFVAFGGDKTYTFPAKDITFAGLDDLPVFSDNEIPSGTIDGVNDTFTTANVPIINSEHLYLNGIRQVTSVDYSMSADTITFTIPPPLASTMIIDYRY